jgi:uncharacterized protein (DUF952 family)
VPIQTEYVTHSALILASIQPQSVDPTLKWNQPHSALNLASIQSQRVDPTLKWNHLHSALILASIQSHCVAPTLKWNQLHSTLILASIQSHCVDPTLKWNKLHSALNLASIQSHCVDPTLKWNQRHSALILASVVSLCGPYTKESYLPIVLRRGFFKLWWGVLRRWHAVAWSRWVSTGRGGRVASRYRCWVACTATTTWIRCRRIWSVAIGWVLGLDTRHGIPWVGAHRCIPWNRYTHGVCCHYSLFLLSGDWLWGG